MAESKRLTDATAWEISERAEEVLSKILQGRDECGVYVQIFCGLDVTEGLRGWQQIFQFPLGYDEAFDEERRIISGHKASTLMVEHALDHNVVSSWSFRDPKRWAYGGAIIVPANIPELGGDVKLLIVCDGLREEENETFGILLARALGWGSGEQNTKIIIVSGNALALRWLM